MEPPITAVAISGREDTSVALASILGEVLPQTRFRVLSPGDADPAELESADVLLLDGSLSSPDPVELCRRLKADPRLQHVPVLMLLPPGSSPEFSRRALEAGADGLLPVPPGSAELAAQLRTLARLSAANRAERRVSPSFEERAGEPTSDDGPFRAAFDAVSDVIWILDPEGRVLQANRAAEIIFRRPLGEIVGRYCWEMVACGHGTASGCPLCRIGETLHPEKLVLELEGRWFEIVVEPIQDQAHTLTGLVHIFRDITAYRTIAEELRKSEERFRQVFESAAVGKCLVLPDGRIQIANQTFAEIFGYGRDELPGKTWEELMPAESSLQGTLFDSLQASPEERPTARATIRHVRRDGSTVWLDLTSVLLKDSGANPLGFIVTAVDMSSHKEAEARLAESEARYRALFENMNGGFVLFEVVQDDRGVPADLIILAGNKGFESTTGLSLAEVTGRRLTEVLPGIEKDSANWIGTYGRVALTGEPCHFERGSELLGRQYSVNAYRPVPNQCAVTFLDVTGTRQAEMERDMLFQAIALSVQEVYLFDADSWRFRFVSQGAQRNLGYAMEQLRQMTPLDLTPEFDTESFSQMVAPLLAGEKAYQAFETVHRRADASLYPVEVRLQLFEYEGERVFLALILDLTERRRAEAERARLVQAIEQTADTILITSPEGAIQYVNPAFAAATGYSREEVLGRNPKLLKSGLHDEAFYRDLWETITSGRTWKGRFINRRKDGTLYQEESTISPVVDEKGRIVNYLAVKRDITRQLAAAEEKARLEEQLHHAQRLESVGRLAGGIAHDFNNMLGVILGYGESILEQLREGDPLRQEVEEIMRAAQRSSALTRQLLAFSRRQTLKPEVIDLNTVIRNMEKLLGRLIGEDIRLRLMLSENLHPVLADPSQMEQVIMNLAVNARDAMPAGGTLILETSNQRLTPEYTQTHTETEPGDYVMLAVTDTGIGMDREVMSRIFDPFFTTKEHGRGTGLGLSVVYGMVKQSGGHIWVYSEPGRGTTFKIYLPKSEERVQPEEKRAEKAPAARGVGLILVVEDEESLRRLLENFLSRLGYTVTAAANGGEALLLVEEKGLRPDLVITDVVMPNMSGRELVDRLRRTDPRMKALYMSGYTENAIAHHGILDTGIDFIQKPFAIRDLADRVREILSRGS
ncbi:MAG: hypothetical protein Kow001_09130 [Acidobacteriota bacterium]